MKKVKGNTWRTATRAIHGGEIKHAQERQGARPFAQEHAGLLLPWEAQVEEQEPGDGAEDDPADDAHVLRPFE